MAVLTRLLISAKNGTEKFISYPITKEAPINITYQLSDVREPDKRKGSRSLTINLSGTNEINKLFENIFSVNVATQYFNKNIKTPVKYIVDQLENFKGDLQLIKVNIEPDNNIVYECSILGEGGSLFIDLGDKFITGNTDSADDLDFSSHDHTYTRANQIALNVANYGTGAGVIYPFVDKGTNGGSDTAFNVEDFLPCFHKREYIEKIITKTGRTFTSTILDSAEFKKHITYPNLTEVPLTLAQLQNKQFYVGLNANQNLPNSVYSTVVYTDDSANGFFDIGGQLDASNTFVTLNASGIYNVAAVNYVKITVTHSDPNVAYFRTTTQLVTRLEKSSDGGATFYTLATHTDLPTVVTVLPGLSSYPIGVPIYGSGGVATGSTPYGAGDVLRVKVFCMKNASIDYYDSLGANYTPTGTLTYVAELISGTAKTSFYALCSQKAVISGDTMTCNSALPTKIKQKDYLKSIIQGLNLFIDIDPLDSNNLIIESFEDFYSGDVIDYRNRTDISKQQTINPNILDGKRYIYTYKEDKDKYNVLYKDEFNEVFGTEIIEIESDFKKEDKKNELIFSPTPNVANYGMGIAHPRIYKEENLIKKTITPNIRWLICGGVMQSTTAWTYKESGLTDLITNDYFYAGHTDDPMNPTIDLNFGLPKRVYYDYPNTYFTNNNFYNKYHAKYLNNIIHRDGKFVTKYLWLSPKDIYLFNFRNRLFIDGAYYIVNKIENYNPLEETSTKVELIKLLETDVFSPSSFKISDMPNINGGQGVLSARLNSSLNVGNSVQNQGTNCIAIGENIVIPESCTNVTVIGNNVTVAEGVSNSSVINTNNYELTQSDFNITNSVVATDLFRTGEIETNNATTTKLVFDTPTGEFDVQQDQTMRIEVRVIATNQNGSRDSKEWVAQGVAEGQSPPTYNVVESVTSTFSDASVATATFAIVATGTPGDDFLEFQVTGIAATDIKWKCQVEIVKIQN